MTEKSHKALRTLFRATHLPLPQVLNMKSLIAFPDDAPLGFMKLSMLMNTSFFCRHFFDFTLLFEVRAMAHYFSFNVFQLKYSYTISPLSFPLSNPSHDSPVLLSVPCKRLNTLNSLLSFLLTSPGCDLVLCEPRHADECFWVSLPHLGRSKWHFFSPITFFTSGS